MSNPSWQMQMRASLTRLQQTKTTADPLKIALLGVGHPLNGDDAAGIAIAAGGILRDLILAMPGGDSMRAATPYIPVFLLEALFLVAALCVIWRLHAPTPRNLGVEP